MRDRLSRFWGKYWKTTTGLGLLWFVIFWFSLPEPLFEDDYSYLLTDKNGRLLQAHSSNDGQWRFPSEDSLPERFTTALILYEDRHFNHHPGVDLLAMARAVRQNLKAGKIVSGASTISMQVVRLSGGKTRRNFVRKLLEIVLALRLECRYSKQEILGLYAGHAPFGGNVVGLRAASWRYFGRSPHELSWAETAVLAVLPNSPGLIHPGRNRRALLEKRNRLLDKLFKNGVIDRETNRLAQLEKIPDKPLPLPQFAPHLLSSLRSGKLVLPGNPARAINTSLDLALQQRVSEILLRHQQRLRGNSIYNAAALVMEVGTGKVAAYVGNVYLPDHPEYDSHVDVIASPRSPGSTLKPFLYEAMLADGLLLPHTLLPDIPTQIAGYAPKNFDLGYDGAVPASQALSRSLNIPAVRILQQYRTERFYSRLKRLGIYTLKQPAGHYGLSLILGGGENTLWELAGLYASMGRVLLNYPKNSGRYDPSDIHPPRLLNEKTSPGSSQKQLPGYLFQAATVYQTLEAMQEVMRPGDELLWQQFTSSQRIAWKTGTSFGFRDGWAIGMTPGHVVAVWVGNADGEGRPGLIGVETAAPVMFEIFRLLPVSGNWFPMPYAEMAQVPVCRRSGYRAQENCEETDSVWIAKAGLKSLPCPYHQLVHLDREGQHRVTSDCYPAHRMQHRSWFVLPPLMEWYYKSNHPEYQTLPSFSDGCKPQNQPAAMEMIYPRKSNRIFIPVELDGETGKCVFEVAHRQANARVYWHLDRVFIGTTTGKHQMALSPAPGNHQLVLTDDAGEILEQGFEVIEH